MKNGVPVENLRVPYGLNEFGELVSAQAAQSVASYKCPCCYETLVYRAGDIRTKHFAHPPSSTCNLESILHITAKKLIQSVIVENSKGTQTIALENHCRNCGVVFSTSIPGKTFSNAGVEVRVGNYVCDVVGYRGNSIALAIEILNTHKVDSAKAQNLDTRWVELKADDVIKDPVKWAPTQANLKDSYCCDCKKHIKHVFEVADKYGIERSLYSPVKDPSNAKYIAAVETCFKCKQETPVFWWQGVPFCEQEPPNPKPRTIKPRHSKQFGGTYWANTCASCSMIQGDNYLYLFENAPFKGLPLSTDTQNETVGVRVVSGKSAVSEFMRVLKRNL